MTDHPSFEIVSSYPSRERGMRSTVTSDYGAVVPGMPGWRT
jgi:hypothetical protein